MTGKVTPRNEPEATRQSGVDDSALLDAAYAVVLHPPANVGGQPGTLSLDELRVAHLGRQFPGSHPQVIEDANTRARQLLAVAEEMADVARGPKNDGAGPPADLKALAARCPGFSRATYAQAIADGFMMTR